MIKDLLVKLSTLSDANKALEGLFKDDPSAQFWLSAVKRGKKRSTTANAQQHLWYGQIAKHYGDRTALEVKSYCKALLGLPILVNSEVHGDKIDFLLNKLDYYRHSYENRLKLIHCLEVTSLFSTAESKEYMENMIFHFADLGVTIKFKDKEG